MKTTKYLLALVALVLFGACEDWLDSPSETKYDTSSVFSSLSKSEMAVLGVYSSLIHSDLTYRLANGTDELVDDFGNDDGRSLMGQYRYDPSNVARGIFDVSYPAIERANMCLKYLPDVPVSSDADAAKRDRFIGECLAMRAYSYLNLVRFYGDVPYFRIPAEDREDLLTGRVSRDTIYDNCIRDLQEAVRLLPWAAEGGIPIERLSKQAALGLLARTALYAAGYSLRWDLTSYSKASLTIAQRADGERIKELYGIVRDACDSIMLHGENDLEPDYQMLWRNLLTKTANREWIWQIGQYGPNQMDNDACLGYVIGISISSTECLYNKTVPQVRAMPTLWFDYAHKNDSKWTQLDVRRDVTLCNHGLTGDNGTVYLVPWWDIGIGKYRVTWKAAVGSDADHRDISWPMLRYADIVLMYAEAQNELDNLGAAQAALEKILKRACGEAYSAAYPMPADKQAMLAEIQRQRKLELCFEGGLRRTDLARWGILYETLEDEKTKLNALAKQTGDYASVPKWAVYKKTDFTEFEHPIVGYPVDSFYVNSAQFVADSASWTANGYSYANLATSTGDRGFSNEVYMARFFPGLTKLMHEIICFHTSTMDDNPTLKAEQHPAYQ